MREQTLVIGYGNAYCRDDGVALHIINLLRKKSGIEELGVDEDGLDGLGHGFDTIMVHQLIPEMSSAVAKYQTIIFVDSHKGVIPDEIRVIDVKEEYGFHAITHHMSPGMLLALVRKIEGVAPAGYLVSIKGEDFDFGFGLSDVCRARAERAAEKILELADYKSPPLPP